MAQPVTEAIKASLSMLEASMGIRFSDEQIKSLKNVVEWSALDAFLDGKIPRKTYEDIKKQVRAA